MTGHTEQDFEQAIEHELTTRGGYVKRTAADFDAGRCLFPADIVGFIKDTQARQWQQLAALLKDRMTDQVLSDLVKELATKGALHVLRHGFKCYGKTLRLAYFQPNTTMNPEAQALYAKNRLTITRQVAFPSVIKRPDGEHARCIIDVVLSVNGLPWLRWNSRIHSPDNARRRPGPSTCKTETAATRSSNSRSARWSILPWIRTRPG